MAVNKMKKLTVMTDRQVEEEVLQALQETQVIQIKEIPETVYQMFPVEDEIESAEDLLSQKVNEDKETLLGQIMEAMLFIEREVATGKTKLKRASFTLQELEERGNLEQVAEYVQKILSLKEKLQVIEQEKKQLVSEEQALARWIYLDISPKRYADLTYSQTITGSLNLMNQENFLQKLKGLDKVYYEEVYTSPHHAYYFLIVMKEDWRELDRVLSEVGFTYFYYPYEKSPKEMKESFRLRGEALKEEEKRLRKELKGYVDWQESLYLAEEALRAQLVREEAKSSAVYAKDLFILQGWLPEEEEQPLTQLLTERFGKDRVYLTFEEPSNKEIKEEIPTQLSNHTIVEPFEMLTEMYSLPRYDEVDPTPLMMPFYLTFFGMMVADVGYGLLMLIGITLIRRFVVLPKDTERFMRLFQTLSIPIIIWGLIYGSFFGADLYQLLGIKSNYLPLLSTTTDVNQILILSVIFGFIQLMVGLLINGVQLIKQKDYLTSISDGFAWQGLLLGIVVAVLSRLFFHQEVLFMVGVVLACLSALSIVFIPMIKDDSKLKGLAKGLYGLYGITGYVGDLVSYTRLMALGISGGSIAAAFNMIVGFMPPVARYSIGIVLIIALHGLNIFLSLLSAYVHGARLQYVEFFGKFYTGGGRAFKPLKAEDKYVNIERTNKK